MNCPSHVIGGGYVDSSPPANKSYAKAPRASPVETAWEYVIKGIIYFVHYGKERNYTQNRSYTHIPPLNTRKGFQLHYPAYTSVLPYIGVWRQIAVATNSSLLIQMFSPSRRIQPTMYFVALESILGADLQTIFCRIARNADGAIAGLCAVRAPIK